MAVGFKRIMRAVTVFTVVAMFFGGCSKAEKAPDAKDKAAQTQTEASKDVIKFDGGSITVDEVKTILSKMSDRERAQFQTPDGMKNLVNQLADNAALAEAARKEGVADKADVKTLLKIITNVRLSQEYFEQKIKPRADNVTIPTEELQQYYNNNLAKYDSTEVKARHILVRDEAKAKSLYDQVKAKPAKFSELAKANSEDKGSGANGGDLGFFTRGRMVPEFETAAFALKVGEISQPVKTQFGFHIIIVDERKENGVKPFEEVKGEIENELKRGKSQEVVTAAIEDVKAKMNLKVDDSLLSQIQVPASPALQMPGQAPAGGQVPPPPPPAPTR